MPSANTFPDTERSSTSRLPRRWWAPSPSAAASTAARPVSSTSVTLLSRASAISLARRATRSMTSSGSVPDSSAVEISADASSHRSRRRVSSYSRAFSIATPAAVASAVTTTSSSSSKAPPPAFSVR
ncbi:Uncharacterised protein [Mycobacterium tuberculosis]|nr:Uncharacterised protein [Mycobacterium tuberculosis]